MKNELSRPFEEYRDLQGMSDEKLEELVQWAHIESQEWSDFLQDVMGEQKRRCAQDL